MAFNGSGVFSRLYNWLNDRDASIPITASRMDAEMDGFATGLSACVTKDGQTNPTANLPMATYRHTGVGNASARNDYAAAGQVQDSSFLWGGTAGGTADALTLTLTPAITAYAAGQTFRFIANANNTGAATININSVGAKTIQNNGSALAANDIVSGKIYEIVYDGTQFQISQVRLSGGDVVNDTTPQLGGDLDRNGNLANLPVGWGNVLAPHENLVITRPTAATVDIDANAVLLRDTNDYVYKASSVNLTVNITASGANGLDTGLEATSTWYYLWVIYNGTTVAGLLSTSSTAPTMPSGYTYKGLVGAVYNDSGGNFVSFKQYGKAVLLASTNALTNGTATSITAVDISDYVPPLTIEALLRIEATNTSGPANKVLTIRDETADSRGQIELKWYDATSNGGVFTFRQEIIITGQDLYYANNTVATQTDIAVIGFKYL